MLRATGNCSKANTLIEKGLQYIDRIKKKEVIPERPQNIARDMSNLLAIKALCSDDLGYMGKTLYRAIEIDPTNEYAVNRGTELLAQVGLAYYSPPLSLCVGVGRDYAGQRIISSSDTTSANVKLLIDERVLRSLTLHAAIFFLRLRYPPVELSAAIAVVR